MKKIDVFIVFIYEENASEKLYIGQKGRNFKLQRFTNNLLFNKDLPIV